MSNSPGEVWHREKLVGHYKYNGSSDVACTRIFKTFDELWENWGSLKVSDAQCTCGQPPQDVILYSDYGGGFHWPGKACLKCETIIGPRMPYEEYKDDPCPWVCAPIWEDGHPFEERKPK